MSTATAGPVLCATATAAMWKGKRWLGDVGIRTSPIQCGPVPLAVPRGYATPPRLALPAYVSAKRPPEFMAVGNTYSAGYKPTGSASAGNDEAATDTEVIESIVSIGR